MADGLARKISHTIVMVTNVKEDKKTKCQQYWPDSDSKEFGPFRITLADQQIFANYTIRLLQVEVSMACVNEYHYTLILHVSISYQAAALSTHV